jgi:hypothetical protein
MQQNCLQKAGVPDLFAHFFFAVSGAWTKSDSTTPHDLKKSLTEQFEHIVFTTVSFDYMISNFHRRQQEDKGCLTILSIL